MGSVATKWPASTSHCAAVRQESRDSDAVARAPSVRARIVAYRPLADSLQAGTMPRWPARQRNRPKTRG